MVLVDVVPAEGVRGVAWDVEELDAEVCAAVVIIIDVVVIVVIIIEDEVREVPCPVGDGVFWRGDAEGRAQGVCGEVFQDEGGVVGGRDDVRV